MGAGQGTTRKESHQATIDPLCDCKATPKPTLEPCTAVCLSKINGMYQPLIDVSTTVLVDIALANPKSQSFTTPFADSNMFYGFMSR